MRASARSIRFGLFGRFIAEELAQIPAGEKNFAYGGAPLTVLRLAVHGRGALNIWR